MFHVKPFVQFNLRLETEQAEVLAALASDAGVKPGKMLSRMVGEALGKRRGELLLSARVGPPVGSRKDRLKETLEALDGMPRERFNAGFKAAMAAAEVDGPLVEETTEDPDFIVEERMSAPVGESRDCPTTVGIYRCVLQAGHEDVHEWGNR